MIVCGSGENLEEALAYDGRCSGTNDNILEGLKEFAGDALGHEDL